MLLCAGGLGHFSLAGKHMFFFVTRVPQVVKSDGVLVKSRLLGCFGIPRVAKSYGVLVKNMFWGSLGGPKVANSY